MQNKRKIYIITISLELSLSLESKIAKLTKNFYFTSLLTKNDCLACF